MRWGSIALVLVAGGCKFTPGNPLAGSGGSGDGGLRDSPPDMRLIDAPPDGTGDLKCFGPPPSPFHTCFSAMPMGATTISGDIDTGACDAVTNMMSMTVAGTSACVVFGDTITVNGSIDAHGDPPLVLFAETQITIGSGVVLSAASRTGAVPLSNPIKGPGANDGSCTNTATGLGANGSGSSGGGAGGGGGGFGGTGGTGGLSGAGFLGATAGAQQSQPATLRGGCAGGDGGNSGGTGGDSGGAIYLATNGALHVDGQITANGAGGSGTSNNKAAGGGGGSGGLNVIAAHSLVLGTSGAIVANGGGGGGGDNGNNPSRTGADSATPLTAASPGGMGGGGAGNGGAGNGGTSTSGSMGDLGVQSGGGGGGGAGWILVLTNVVIPAAQASPPPTHVP